MTGLQVAEAIKKTNTKTPVILITGWELQLKDSELKKSGINLVVNKPFKVEQVLRLVQECEKKAISKAKSEF
jgi:CheY-like chemotaxis protein